MKNGKSILAILLCAWMVAVAVVPVSPAWANSSQTPGGSGSGCSNGTGSNGQCNSCISDSQYQYGQQAAEGAASFAIAETIIPAVFGAINGVLNAISQNFYNGIVNNSSFQNVVSALVILYVTIYGVLIMFNLASARPSEVITRLAKIGILWSIVSPSGWNFFSTYVGNLFVGGMNELIGQFSGVTVSASTTNANLDGSVVNMLYAPMDAVFAPKFMAGMLSLVTVGQGSWLLAGMLAWGLMDFIFMVIAAIATYVKSIVGLLFLFGISPIFFCCLLFEKTRQTFMGWLNEVAAFALLPVLLFGFLSFYVQLLTSVLTMMLPMSLDFCWMHWFSVPNIWDVSFWRPVSSGNQTAGDWTDSSGNPLPPPISTLFGLYFLVLSWLGKNFCSYISHIVSDLTQGIGPGAVSADALKGKFMSALGGGGGKGGGGAGAQAAKAAQAGTGRDGMFNRARAGGAPSSTPGQN